MTGGHIRGQIVTHGVASKVSTMMQEAKGSSAKMNWCHMLVWFTQTTIPIMVAIGKMTLLTHTTLLQCGTWGKKGHVTIMPSLGGRSSRQHSDGAFSNQDPILLSDGHILKSMKSERFSSAFLWLNIFFFSLFGELNFQSGFIHLQA
jgi:hypothetical protein